jgi:hypothetical protein
LGINKYRMIPTTVHPQLLSREDIDRLVGAITSISLPLEYFDNSGVWKDKGLMANVIEWKYNDPANQHIQDILDPVLRPYLGEFVVDKSHILDARLPWDIHNDYVSVCSELPNEPQAVVIIPIEDTDSSTIVFHQTAKYSDFQKYRESNPPLKDCVKQTDWDLYLNHCWPKDRFWLTIDHVFQWRKGAGCIMDRQTFHASDSFHQRIGNKRAIILFTCYPLDAIIQQ